MRDYELGLGIEESIDISTVPEDETIKLLVKNTHNYLIDSIDGI
jgi:hypothetical protein